MFLKIIVIKWIHSGPWSWICAIHTVGASWKRQEFCPPHKNKVVWTMSVLCVETTQCTDQSSYHSQSACHNIQQYMCNCKTITHQCRCHYFDRELTDIHQFCSYSTPLQKQVCTLFLKLHQETCNFPLQRPNAWFCMEIHGCSCLSHHKGSHPNLKKYSEGLFLYAKQCYMYQLLYCIGKQNRGWF